MHQPVGVRLEGKEVQIEAGPVVLTGNLSKPIESQGLVLIIHESGSNRFNPLNRYLARGLNQAGVATLLFDWLEKREAEFDKVSRHLRFDIDLIVERTIAVTAWVREQPDLQGFQVGYFGCGRGAAAAMIAACQHPEDVSAIVSLGGRLDLARVWLSQVSTPTLLVAGMVKSLLAINQRAIGEMPLDLEKKLEIFDRVSYFWEEPDTIGKLSRITTDWFNSHLGRLSEGSLSQVAGGW
jgi:putative phosphoribosyl transferase